jgi:hypothetical protein
MPGIHRKKELIHQFALCVAAGENIRAWCDEHGVRHETAHRWYKEDQCRRLVEEYRGRAVDLAIGRMAEELGVAVEKIIELIEKGQTDGVKLSAAKVLVEKLIAVQNHAELRAELRRLHDRLGAQEKRRARGTARHPKPARPA